MLWNGGPTGPATHREGPGGGVLSLGRYGIAVTGPLKKPNTQGGAEVPLRGVPGSLLHRLQRLWRAKGSQA